MYHRLAKSGESTRDAYKKDRIEKRNEYGKRDRDTWPERGSEKELKDERRGKRSVPNEKHAARRV